MLKKLKKSSQAFKITISVLLIFSMISSLVIVHADQYEAQINALKQQNNTAQSNINNLANQATSYQDAINQLQNQISIIQNALSINEAKQQSLQDQITADINKINQQKKYLGEDIRTMYVQGQLSTLEELATSKNLSDYVNREQYRIAVQNKIDDLIGQIANLESQLKKQKDQLDILVNTESQQNAELTASQDQQQQLLNYNQSQQDAFNSQIQSNQSQIASLRAQQIAANHQTGGVVQASGACGGGYPADAINSYGGHWGCNYSLDNTSDNWGMYNRECVSYTAWMVYKTYGYMPYWGGYGNAKQWPGDAQAAGIPTGSTPKVGSVAISTAGPFGHAMWVIGVSGNNIIVNQYNLYYDGNFYQTVRSSAGLTYIYFGG